MCVLRIATLHLSHGFWSGPSIHPKVHSKYIQAFLRALKSPPYHFVLVIFRALKSLNVNACRVNRKLDTSKVQTCNVAIPNLLV